MLTSVSICRNLLYYIAFGTKQSSVSNAQKHFKQAFFLKMGFTPCRAEQSLHGMELQEKKTQKD